MYLLQNVPQRITDSTGAIAGGALMHTYITGTTTNKTAYTDQAGTTPHENPIVASAEGTFAQVWLNNDTEYRIKVTKSDGTVLFTWDDVSGIGASADSALRADLALADNTAKGAGLSGFDWDLNYAVDTVGWGLMTARYSILKYIPVAQWAAIFAGTTTYDATANIASALAAEKLITMPHGKIRGEWDLLNKRGITIRGAGRDVTTLENVDNTAVFTLGNGSSDCKNIRFEHFKIVNRDEAVYTTCDGFLINGGSSTNEEDFNTWSHVDVVNMRYGWSVAGRAIWYEFANCHAFSCVDGWHVDTTENVSVFKFTQCRSGANTGYGMASTR